MSYVYVVSLSEEYCDGSEVLCVAGSIETALARVVATFGRYGIPETELKFTEHPWGFQYTGVDQYLDEVYVCLERYEVL